MSLPGNLSLNYGNVAVDFPECINYKNSYYSIPEETVSYEATVNPNNGSTFSNGSQIILDIASNGFIDPDSFYFRYKDTTTTAVNAVRVGVPAYTPFSRLDVLFNNSQKESIVQYNQVANMIVNLTFDIAQKAGMQAAFGFVDGTTATVPTFYNIDGRTILTANEVASYSGLLIGSCLTSASQLLPAFAMGTIRLIFTLDTLTNMFSQNAAVQPTGYSLYNFELCYTVIQFPQHYMNQILKNHKIYIKTMSFNNSSQQVPMGTSGFVTLVYNQRFSSMKSIFVHPSGTSASLSGSGLFDAVDITGGNGDYQLVISGVVHPQRALSTTNNKNGIIMELRKAVGALYNPGNSLSINGKNFSYTTSSTTGGTCTSKFYVGVALEKLHLSQEMMSGISTNNQAISLNVNINTATGQAINVNLIILYDMMLEVDLVNQQVNTII